MFYWIFWNLPILCVYVCVIQCACDWIWITGHFVIREWNFERRVWSLAGPYWMIKSHRHMSFRIEEVIPQMMNQIVIPHIHSLLMGMHEVPPWIILLVVNSGTDVDLIIIEWCVLVPNGYKKNDNNPSGSELLVRMLK